MQPGALAGGARWAIVNGHWQNELRGPVCLCGRRTPGRATTRTVAQARWPVWKANGAGLCEMSESHNGASPELAHGGSDVMQSLPARLDEYMVDPAGRDTGALASLEGSGYACKRRVAQSPSDFGMLSTVRRAWL